MAPGDLSEVLSLLPQAVVQVDRLGRVRWVEPCFGAKTGLELQPGQSALEVLEGGRVREELERAIAEAQRYQGTVVTCALKQAKVRVCPVGAMGECYLLFEPAGLDDEVEFAGALEQIAQALGGTLEVDRVCAQAVVALVRCAQVRRAELYLVEEGQRLRQVVSSDLADSQEPCGMDSLPEESLKHVLATRQPQVGVSRGVGGAPGPIFAAVPLASPRRALGLMVLYKDRSSSFSMRELDLWAAAAGQISVGVENARLLKEAQAALRIRDEFLSIASHELKTPLTPLKMGLDSMERRIRQGLPVELASVVKSQRQVDRLHWLVHDLLDASRVELGKLEIRREPIELAQLVAEVVAQFRLSFERQFELELEPARHWIWGDRDRLEQVLVNLLENAHKYSPPEEPVRVRLERSGEEICLAVSDRGIGIPLADQASVFQRFHRAANASPRNFGGLGLGLYLSQSMVQLQGGTLSLSSEEGRGSTFTVRLPRMSAPEIERMPPRVLLVLEEPVARERLQALLQEARLEVFSAREGGEALRQLGQLPVDVVLVSSALSHGALFVETMAKMPLVRPVPVVFLGEGPPPWGGAGARCCTELTAQKVLRSALSSGEEELAAMAG